jgi:hypothetical protein
MKDNKASTLKHRGGKRIEWTGAGGDHYLGVVADQKDQVVSEYWGTRREILTWMETRWPQLPTTYVPMVYVPARRHAKLNERPPLRSKKHHAG